MQKKSKALDRENYFMGVYDSIIPNGFNYSLNGGYQCNIDYRDIKSIKDALKPLKKKVPSFLVSSNMTEDRFKKLITRRTLFLKEEVALINKILGTKIKIIK